jgi:hypothetical protein
VRTHPVDKLLEQNCYKSAAGLLQLVRFYMCNSRESIIPVNTRDHCLSDFIDHDHIHEELFLLYFWEVVFIICFLSINTRSEFIELISMLYISD